MRGSTRSAEEYGYKSGVVLPSSGILRVSVSPEQAVVDYLKADPTSTVVNSYAIKAK